MKVKGLLAVVGQVISGCRSNEAEKKHLLFKDGGIYSWSPALSVSARLPEDCKGLSGIVNGQDFMSVLSKLGRDEIEVSCEKDGWHITSGDIEVLVVTKEDESLAGQLARLATEDLEWKALPTNFYDCLAICDLPNNQSRVAGVFMYEKSMVSTDNRRVNHAKMDGTIDEKVLLSPYSITEIRNLTVKFTEYAVSHRWMHFRTVVDGSESLVFSCNRLDESVYTYDRFIGLIDKAKECLEVTGVFPPLKKTLALAQCFDSVEELGRNNVVTNAISLKFDRKKLTVASERGASGKFSEKLSYPEGTELDVESPIAVKISAPFLASALVHTNNFGIAKLGATTLIVLLGKFFTTVIQVFGV
jgi:hypothetical protein